MYDNINPISTEAPTNLQYIFYRNYNQCNPKGLRLKRAVSKTDLVESLKNKHCDDKLRSNIYQ